MSLGTGALSTLPVTSRDLALGDSANYYVAVTPTAGTGIVTGNPTALVNTTPALVVFNGGLLTVYLMYLRIASTVVGGGAATKNFTHQIDQGNRYGTATTGTQLTINNTNILSNVKSSVQATWGAITGAGIATANVRLLGNDWFRVALADVVGDVYEFQYGSPVGTAQGSSVATVASFTRSAPAVVLPPQSSYVLNIWSATFTAGITAEVQLGFAEK
ncbi:hypothetical protein HYZ97_02765 [Candidatus Pacearchaeota archaeon]|nr:hypothetical protein [Candidatus Pacearchaeota archaeon]